MLSQYLSPVVMATFMLRLVAAMPATFPVDPELANAIHQRDGQGMINGAPGCGTDPSYASGVSQFTDGEGVYIGSDCDNHLTTLPLKRFHCWTDYFLVGTKPHYDSWQNTGTAIDCATTQSCSDIKAVGSQSCTTNTWSVSTTISVGLEAQFEWATATASVSVTGTYGQSQQTCTTVTDTTTCSWADQQCHSIWLAPRKITQLGYIRRSCNTPRSGVNMPDSPQRSDGYYTIGMQDFSYDLPTSSGIVGCAANCSAISYPDPLPSNPTTITPQNS